jgi:hypothetical protein
MGKPVPEAHKLAVEVSAYVCTQSGAMPELPQVLKTDYVNCLMESKYRGISHSVGIYSCSFA